jgi:RNase P subunit RPR2
MSRPLTERLECKKCNAFTENTLHWKQRVNHRKQYRLARRCVQCGNSRVSNQKQRWAWSNAGIIPPKPDTVRQMEMFKDED